MTTIRREDLSALMAAVGFTPTIIEHPPVRTVEDSHEFYDGLEGAHTKNVFLKDAKGALFLITVPAEARLDMKALPEMIGSRRLSFGSAELMQEVLDTQPGSLGPLSLVADRAHRVTFAIDASLLAAESITCHPLDNTQTWVLPVPILRQILDHLGVKPIVFTAS